MRKIRLPQQIASVLGFETIELEVDRPADAIRAISTQNQEVARIIGAGEWQIIEGAETLHLWEIFVHRDPRGDLELIPAPTGAGDSGAGKILGGLFLGLAVLLTGGALGPALIPAWASYIGGAVALSLAFQGLQQLLAPTPTFEPQALESPGSRQSTLLQASGGLTQGGNCIPVIYGRSLTRGLRVSQRVRAVRQSEKDDDVLVSDDFMEQIDILSEGEISGVAGDGAGVLADGLSVVNIEAGAADTGLQWSFRSGSNDPGETSGERVGFISSPFRVEQVCRYDDPVEIKITDPDATNAPLTLNWNIIGDFSAAPVDPVTVDWDVEYSVNEGTTWTEATGGRINTLVLPRTGWANYSFLAGAGPWSDPAAGYLLAAQRFVQTYVYWPGSAYFLWQAAYLPSTPVDDSPAFPSSVRYVIPFSADATTLPAGETFLNSYQVVDDQPITGLDITIGDVIFQDDSSGNLDDDQTLTFYYLTDTLTSGDWESIEIDLTVVDRTSVIMFNAAGTVSQTEYYGRANETGNTFEIELSQSGPPTEVKYYAEVTNTGVTLTEASILNEAEAAGSGSGGVAPPRYEDYPPFGNEFAASWFVDVQGYTAEGTLSGVAQSGYRVTVDAGTLQDMAAEPPWWIRVVRTTADQAANNNVRDEFSVADAARLTKGSFDYPNTSTIEVTGYASGFGDRIPNFSYVVDGMLIRIPNGSTYDLAAGTASLPVTWDGTYEDPQLCNDPAWVLLDLLTNSRYGMGLPDTQIDKWSFMEASRRNCSEVSDMESESGVELRYRFNYAFTKADQALKQVQIILSSMNAQLWVGGGVIYLAQDRPTEVTRLFVNANVIDGLFTYMGTGREARPNVVNVSWVDPDSQWNVRTDQVDRIFEIDRFGRQTADIEAVGVTSYGQAMRRARYEAITAEQENEMAQFKIGPDNILVYPGEVIEIWDESRAEASGGGRVLNALEFSGQMWIYVDTVELDATAGDELFVMLDDGTIFNCEIDSLVVSDGSTRVVGVSGEILPIGRSIPDGAAWLVQNGDTTPSKWRVLGIEEDSPRIYTVTASMYQPEKWDSIDDVTDRGSAYVAPSTVWPPT